MILSWRNLGLSAFVSAAVAAIVLACGSDKNSTFNDGPIPTGTFDDGSFGGDSGPGPDLTLNDPFPPWCGPDSGTPQPQILGTEQCPDDKNLPGCGCDHAGETAPCWTGLRRQRNLGVCADGKTTCIVKNEVLNVWGDCVGETLPNNDAGAGKDGCGCFSVGTWDIANTSPCLRNDGTTWWAYSTVYSNGQATFCGEPTGSNPATISPAGVAPTGVWSPNKLKVDCAGTFKLCFRIRQGSIDNPQASDCTLGEVCTDTLTYPTAGVTQDLPDLKTWAGTDNACAKKWDTVDQTISPGYGEMVVKGESVHCDNIDDGHGNELVFHRVEYCARMCRGGANPTAPQCQSCQLRGTGSFN
jgi:hypothetical protein